MHFIHQFNKKLLNKGWAFNEMAKSAYDFQLLHNPIYRRYISIIGSRYDVDVNFDPIKFAFMPISFFKTNIVKTGKWDDEITFTSSGTSGNSTSCHRMIDVEHYKRISTNIFESFYSSIDQYKILALLPSYFNQPSSSLLYMIDHFIQLSSSNESKYILEDVDQFQSFIDKNESSRLLLWGVSYALLDLVENMNWKLPKGSIVLETGGMKGRRKELTKEELHNRLMKGFNVDSIHSEYGMTELSSQAYSKGNGLFFPAATMHVSVSEINDPLTVNKTGRGILNIIDLANIHSCCFIQTEDVGEVFEDGSFRIYGRLDNSLLRGCNLLYPE